MVDIEEGALRPLEEDALPLAPRLGKKPPRGAGIGQDAGRNVAERCDQRSPVDLVGADAAAKCVVVSEEPVDLHRQCRGIREVDDANGATADLVLVSRADAALGGADRLRRVGALARRIELAVERQDERGVFGEDEIFRRHRHALGFQALDLVEEGPRVDHHAVADHRELARPHHPGGEQAQLVADAVDDERVAGIMPALEANDDVGALGQPVDDLALALVPPLRPDDDDIGHFRDASPEGV